MSKIFNFNTVTNLRKSDAILKHNGLKIITELEKTYGKYLFVPFDIPIIRPHDIEAFVSWFRKSSERAVKIKPNIANSQTGNNHFFTINDAFYPDEQWTGKVVNDIFILFPELKEQLLEYFPITRLDRWRMWNSTAKIIAHRDHETLVDFPMAFRTLLYDNNPSETLWLRKDYPTVENASLPKLGPHMKIKIRPHTNSYAWNNIRTYHGSEYDPQYFKILWIISSDYNLDIKKYIDLMDRSISKFNDLSFVDDSPSDIYYSNT